MLLALALLLAACNGAGVPEAAPAPTEHLLDEDAEGAARDRRRAWLESMHRTADGVDWRAIERENGRRAQARRNALQRAGLGKAATNPWWEVGSSNQAGRMHCAARSSDGSRLYAGAALGGLWSTAPDGSDWTPLGDNLYGGVYDLAVLDGEHPGDPDVLVVRTGSKSVRVSRDLGASWETPTGLGGLNGVLGFAVLSTPVPTLLAAVHVNGIGNELAVRASTDHGRTFVQRWKSPSSGKGWMWVPRTGPAALDTIYLGRRGDVLVSTNGGFDFNQVGVSDGAATDVRLVGSEAGAPTLYAMVSVGGTWQLTRSDDAGQSFAHVHTPTEFWGALEASSVDPDVVLYGGVEAHRSGDGGASFSKVNGWGQYYGNPAVFLHADIMGFDVWPDPLVPGVETWYVSTDGGVYASSNLVQDVQNLSLAGLGVSQYYSTLSSSSDGDLILAGSQDQGYQFGDWQFSVEAGPSTPFDQLISGDYGHLSSSDGTHGLVYSTYPGFMLVSEGQGTNQLHTANFPSTNHSWLPPVVADPLDANGVFFCGDRLWRYQRSGNSWVPSQHSAQSFTQNGASYLSALAFAPTDANRAYAATDNGRLHHSSDHGSTWTASSSTAPSQHYFYGTAIDVHPADPLEAAVGGSGYSNAGVVRTTDGGVTWTAEAAGLPSTLVYDLVYARDGSGDLYAATEAGPWRWDRASGLWSDLSGATAPLTTYWSVEAVGTDLIRFATYGRGIWDYRSSPQPAWHVYGAGKATSAGNVPILSATGASSLSANDFEIHVTGGPAGNLGVMMLADEPGAIPFANGTLWLSPPVTRGPIFSVDVLTLAQVPIAIDASMVGTTRYHQAWMRDPSHPDGTGIALSDAMAVSFAP